MTTFVWGSTTHGELGLGGVEDEFILTPREMDWFGGAELKQAACGTMHTLLLTNQGKVYSCGNNDYGQLGHELSRKRPQVIEALENDSITQISCGAAHSLALNEWGQIFSWGSDTYGQLGIELGNIQSIAKIVRSLATQHIIQIACGHYHCLALTNGGDLYAWGLNNYGQLGLGHTQEKVSKPTIISSLKGIPIAFICCGANHSFVVSKSGAVFGWGKNAFGQLGVNDIKSRSYPTQLKTLRNLGVRYIACGDDFSVFLTMEGGVFTCGLGVFGQLGHGYRNNEILPRMVVELMGSTVTQISCGRKHTLVLVPSRGRVYGFGLGGSGQLGSRAARNSMIPQLVIGPWVSPNGQAIIETADGLQSHMIIKRIFAGGDHCIASAIDMKSAEKPIDCRIYDDKAQILSLTLELASSCSEVSSNTNVDLDIISALEVIFKNQACINASFLLNTDKHLACTSKYHGIDIAVAESAFEYIRKIENDSIKELIWESVTKDLLSSLVPSPADVETLRIYLILPLYHEFINSKNYLKLHSPFSFAVLSLTEIPIKIVKTWWSLQSVEYYERLIENFKSVVSHIIHFHLKKESNAKQVIGYEKNMDLALRLLSFLFLLNHENRLHKVPYETFHMPELHDTVDIEQDYCQWLLDKNNQRFHLFNHPFIFDARAKTLALQTDQVMQMQNAMQQAATQGFLMMVSGTPGAVSQYLMLVVTRENIVEDTIRELTVYGTNDYKKPLKVKFHGEEAEDAGGVRKEFFMLLLKEVLDPKYGMFREYDDSRYIWFSDISFEGENMYMLIGFLCGLAIYNFTIINLPFPLALYKKILNEPVDLSDLRDLSPTIAKSMQNILDYHGDDIEDVYRLTFSISREVYGEMRTINLKPNGDEIAVNQANKHEFVDLYIDYIFNKSVATHFNGFNTCFHKVCGGRTLNLFKPHELMAMVVGNEEYDWDALETMAEYKNGYTSSDQTIRWFWEVFHDMPLSDKKKFLLFLTGSDRIPILGMKAIKIYIQPVTDDKFLPVAHTCFNLLDLPRYNTKEILQTKLLQAIQQTHGFSLV